jgi:hypothetical protein
MELFSAPGTPSARDTPSRLSFTGHTYVAYLTTYMTLVESPLTEPSDALHALATTGLDGHSVMPALVTRTSVIAHPVHARAN